MKCPVCSTDFDSEKQLSATPATNESSVPWYRPAPRRKPACPVCGVPLKHNRMTLSVAVALGAAFIAALCLKTLYPEVSALKTLFAAVSIALLVGLPLLMRHKGSFRRADS